MKLLLHHESKLFERLYCVDFVKNDPPEIVELQPENILTFALIEGSFGEASLSVEHLRWDDVLLYHDSTDLPPQALSLWFRQWFDPEDERHDPAADLSRVIHSMLIEPSCVSVDFGTAEPEAFWDMLNLLEGAGARRIRISSSRADAPATS